MTLMNQWCGPPASPYEDFNHSFVSSADGYGCEWCGKAMSKDEAKEWATKFGMKVVVRLNGRREWSET